MEECLKVLGFGTVKRSGIFKFKIIWTEILTVICSCVGFTKQQYNELNKCTSGMAEYLCKSAKQNKLTNES